MIINFVMMFYFEFKKVFVIGGGDGGVFCEVVKYDCVEEVIFCDIDEVSLVLVF